MLEYLKKYLSVFCLALFLFPLIEKDVHAFEHQSDLHCDATDKHFHELEHTCSLCDFTITDSNYPAEDEYQLIVPCQPFLFHSYIESVNIPGSFQYIPARAPPVNLI